jgi:GWxTD domain-containing protein
MVICLLAPCQLLGQSDRDSLQQEESVDYFQRWLEEDVVYIITNEERSVFENLSTIEEKEQFIEQFWFRRDQDPRTAENEFKEEHYRRLAYSNEHFSSGKPGWKSDRGRIYIIHGPPAELEAHPTGGHHVRPMTQGGGTTTTYPFEVWRYRHIEGVGDDIILEFVDKTMTGEYRLALLPEEKDALLYIPGAGPTVAEELGLATKADRPFFNPGNRENYPGMIQSIQNNPFLRYETFAKVQGPKEIRYTDLKEIVEIDVTYDTLPLSVEAHYFRLGNGEVLVPVTFQIQNKNLSFELQHGVHVARVAVYGIVTTMSKRIVTEFEDDLTLSYRDEVFEVGLLQEAVYQKILALEPKMRYRLDLVVKDLNGDRVGVVSRGLIPPKFSDEVLQASPLVFSNYVRALQEAPDQNEMFVLGDVRIRPNIKKEFTDDVPMGVYFQLYNAEIDQTSLTPSLSVTYEILHNGNPITSVTDLNGESTQFFSNDRVVLIRRFDLSELEAGEYRIRLKVHDRIGDRRVELGDSFKLVESRVLPKTG